MDFQLPISLLNWIALALLTILTGAVGYATKAIVKYAQERAEGAIFDRVRKWAYTYVAALNQDPTLKGLASEEKKQRAMLWLVIKAEKLGIALSEEEASNIIEEAVYLLKDLVTEPLEDALE